MKFAEEKIVVLEDSLANTPGFIDHIATASGARLERLQFDRFGGSELKEIASVDFLQNGTETRCFSVNPNALTEPVLSSIFKNAQRWIIINHRGPTGYKTMLLNLLINRLSVQAHRHEIAVYYKEPVMLAALGLREQLIASKLNVAPAKLFEPDYQTVWI